MKMRIVSGCSASILFALGIRVCLANPTGGTVVGGDGNGTINGSGTPVTTINQRGNRIIINWTDFSIGAGEVTRFVQPSATSWALNRIISGNPSLIYGSLQANGHVMVLNQNGILVGAGAKIDTKGFVASTLDIHDSSFMKGGTLTLSGNSTASVRNDGTIQALGGDVFLIGNTVENNGTISAPQGTVGLAAGSSVRLVPAGNERISVLAGNANGAAANGVHNVGTVEGASAELKAAGGNIYALAINNEGAIRANSIVSEGGHVYLRASGGNIQNSGTISANKANGSGGTVIVDGGHNADNASTVVNSGTIEARGDAAGTKGGTVEMLGDHVGLVGQAVVDVSGNSGGGAVLIGGDAHGTNPNIQNADAVYASPDATIHADALGRGDGGNVVVWSDTATRFYGSISARGGAVGGDGGFVETSGKSFLDLSGAQVDAGASAGAHGNWLMDPRDITIDTAATTGTYTPNYTASANNSHVNVGQINASLDGGTSVTINTGGAGNGNQNGDINVNALILKSTGNDATLSLTAAGAININNNGTTLLGGIQNNSANALNVVLNAGGAVLLGGPISQTGTGAGDLTVTAGAGLTVAAGNPISIAGAVSLTADDNLIINENITAASLFAQSGHDGSGNLTVGAGATVSASSQTYFAGNGVASGNTAALNGQFRNTGGSAAPSVFVYEQGGAIADAAIPDASQFGGTPPAMYTIQADVGNLTITTPAKVAGSALTLRTLGAASTLTVGGGTAAELWTPSSLTVESAGAISFAGDVTATSVSAHSGTDGSGNITFANLPSSAVVDIHADTQSYQAGSGSGSTAVANLIGNTPNFRNTAGSAAPSTFTFRQDAPIDFTDFPDAAAQFGGTLPATYIVQSDGGGVTLPGMTLPGTLQVTAHGDILQNNVLDIHLGASTFTVTAAGSDVILGLANHFGSQTVTINSSGAGSVNDINFHNVDPSAILPVMPGSFHSLTLTLENAPIDLPALNLTGNLNLTAGGPITDSGNIVVNGTTTLAAGAANNITLDNNDDFGGAVTITSGNTVTLNDINGLTVAGTVSGDLFTTAGGTTTFGTVANALHVTGNLNASGNGLISDANAVTVNGATVLAAGAANNITLDNNDDFGGTVTITSGNTVTLNDVNALTVDGTVSGNLITTAGSTTTFGTVANALHVTGNLNASGNGLISDANDLTVNGTTTLAAGVANNITLDNNDDFGGAVTITSGNTVTLNDINGLTVAGTVSGDLFTTAGSTTTFGTVANALHVTGNLNASGNGLISDANAVTVNGTTILAAGAANNITLHNNDDFGGTVTITSGNTVTLNDINALTVDGTVSGNLITTAGSTTIFGTVANALHVTGNLNASGNGLISDANDLTVNGTTTLAAGAANNITLNHNDDFGGAVTITSGHTVALNDINALTVGGNLGGNLLTTSGGDTVFNTINVGGGITATAHGNITGNGAVTANGGPSTFTIDTVIGDVTLGQGNHFGSQLVTINSVNGGAVRDVTLRNVDPTAVAPSLPSTGLRNVTLQYDAAGILLSGLTLSGNLNVTAGGDITQTAGPGGAIIANGAGQTAIFAAGSHNVVLDNNANDFNTVAINSGNDVTVVDANRINLGASTISGNLNVTALNGPITQTGSLLVNGAGKTATFSAAGAGNDIILTDSGNDFTTISLSGNNANIHDANGLDFGASTLSGNLFVTVNGNISQSGALTFSTAGAIASFNAGASHDINLGNAGNDFSTVSIVSGNNVTLQDANALDIGASTISGNFNVTANGFISQSGAIIANGAGKTATFAAGAGNNIFLNNPGNDFTTVAIASGHDVILQDANAIDLGASTISASFSVTARGDITESGALNVTSGSSTFTVDSVTADVLLASQANDFGNQTVSINTVNGGSVRDAALRNINASAAMPSLPAGLRNLLLQFDAAPMTITTPLNASGEITLIAGGLVKEDAGGTISAASLAVTSGGSVTLNGANQVDTVAIDAQGAIQYNDANSIAIGSVNGVNGLNSHDNNITVTTGNGNITVNATTSPVDVEAGNGTVTFTTGSADNGITIATGASVHGEGGVTFTADNMDIAGTLSSGAGNMVLQPLSLLRPLHFGPTDNAGSLNFSQTELDHITSHDLTIGNINTGPISGSASIFKPVTVDQLHILGGGIQIDVQLFANQLASLLAGAILPVPRVEVASFSGAAIDLEQAAKIMEPDAIGTLFLQVPFVPVEAKKYKVEDVSKWTTGRTLASGNTAGPQTPR